MMSTANNTKVSIIIASRNVKEDLKESLTSVFENCTKENVEVLVADNNSTDGTIELLAECFPHVKLCRSEHDNSYPSAINRGIKAATGRYLLLLDSDAIIRKETIPEMVRFLDAHPETGAAVSKMFYPDGSVQLMARRYPTLLNSFFGRETILTRLFPRNKISRRYLMVDELSSTEAFEVDWASSACMMIRREILDDVGLMDEGFLLYWADADFCRRINNSGWKIYCLPQAAIIHDMRNTLDKKKSYFAIKAFHRGVYRYFRKHYTKSPFHPLNLVVFIGLSTRAALQLLLNLFKSTGRVN